MNLYRSTKAELVAEALRRGLPATGTRTDLIDRLSTVHDDDEGPDLMDDDEGDELGEAPQRHHALNPAPSDLDDPPTALPMPPDWPTDLPAPDLSPTVPADPHQQLIPEHGLLEVDPSGRHCRVSYWVSKKMITDGMVDNPVMAALRDRSVDRAVEDGLPARNPRLERWAYQPLAAGGVLTYVLSIRRPR